MRKISVSSYIESVGSACLFERRKKNPAKWGLKLVKSILTCQKELQVKFSSVSPQIYLVCPRCFKRRRLPSWERKAIFTSKLKYI